MKKLVVGLLFAALATCGLVSTTTAPASADPYPGTVPTTVVITHKAKVNVGRRAKVKVSVTAGGNARPSGAVQVIVRRVGGGATFRRTVSYTGGVVKFKTRKLKKPGRYKVKVRYRPTAGSVFAPSKGSSSFKVKRKKKRP